MTMRPLPFYAADWEKDAWVRSAKQRHDWERLGVYWQLLIWCKEDGGIPGDPRALAQLLGLRPARFARLWDDGQATGLRWKFVGMVTGTVGGEPGEQLYNAKMARCLRAQVEYLTRRAFSRSTGIQFEKTARKPARKHRSKRAPFMNHNQEEELKLRTAMKGAAPAPPPAPFDPEDAACTTLEEKNELWAKRLGGWQ